MLKRGDLLIECLIKIPKKVTPKEESVIKELMEAEQNQPFQKVRSFFERFTT